MASGEMTDAEFLAFNGAWMASVLPHLRDGGILGTFIDSRGLPTVHSAGLKLGLASLNHRPGDRAARGNLRHAGLWYADDRRLNSLCGPYDQAVRARASLLGMRVFEPDWRGRRRRRLAFNLDDVPTFC